MVFYSPVFVFLLSSSCQLPQISRDRRKEERQPGEKTIEKDHG